MKYTVTLTWKPDPNFGEWLLNRKSLTQVQVIEAGSANEAEALVLGEYDFLDSARYPAMVTTELTDEQIGLYPANEEG